ncbi:Phytoene dehydrogenase and related proteins [Corynebacterium glutamicum]|nr:Phytoene dehydrogenase and related proteins [Corynebacterium glutamicum]
MKGEHTLLFPPTGTKISAKFSTAPPQNSRLQNPSTSPRPPQQIPMPHPKATRTSSSWSQYPPMSPLVTGPLTEKNPTWSAGSQQQQWLKLGDGLALMVWKAALLCSAPSALPTSQTDTTPGAAGPLALTHPGTIGVL